MEKKKKVTPNESLNGDSIGSDESSVSETEEENVEAATSPSSTIPTAATGSILKSMLLGISPTKIPIQMPEINMANVAKNMNVAKPKRPTTQALVDEAINHFNDRSGSSLHAIKKYILSNYVDFEEKRLSTQIKKYIKASVISGKLTQTKGNGASGSFKMSTQIQKERETASKRKEKEKKNAKKEKEKEEAKLSKKSSKGGSGEPKENKPKATKHAISDKEQEDVVVPLKKSKQAKNSDGIKKTSKGTKEKNDDKTEKAKSKKKVARKSINLLVKTPVGTGHSKSGKKATKIKTASVKKKLLSVIDNKGEKEANAAAVKNSGKPKKK